MLHLPTQTRFTIQDLTVCGGLDLTREPVEEGCGHDQGEAQTAEHAGDDRNRAAADAHDQLHPGRPRAGALDYSGFQVRTGKKAEAEA